MAWAGMLITHHWIVATTFKQYFTLFFLMQQYNVVVLNNKHYFLTIWPNCITDSIITLNHSTEYQENDRMWKVSSVVFWFNLRAHKRLKGTLELRPHSYNIQVILIKPSVQCIQHDCTVKIIIYFILSFEHIYYFIQPQNHHWGQKLCLNFNQEIQPFSSVGM